MHEIPQQIAVSLVPQQIAASLVQQFGLERARREVMSRVIEAREHGANYELSVLREVKKILAQSVAEDLAAA